MLWRYLKNLSNAWKSSKSDNLCKGGGSHSGIDRVDVSIMQGKRMTLLSMKNREHANIDLEEIALSIVINYTIVSLGLSEFFSYH